MKKSRVEKVAGGDDHVNARVWFIWRQEKSKGWEINSTDPNAAFISLTLMVENVAGT